MNKTIFVIILSILFVSCTSTEPDDFRTSKLSSITLSSVEINNQQVTLELSVGTPTPCWEYYKTEKVQNEGSVFLTIYGKDESEACIQILGSFEHSETISFTSKGEKIIKFWLTDSTSIDTTIILE